MSATMTKEDIEKQLPHFYGTNGYHLFNGLFRRHVATDGAKFVADSCNAFWLLEAIASYHAECMADPMLQGIQFWKFKLNDDKESGVLTCERDTDDVAIRQEIPYTDFPLDEIRLWVEPGCDADMNPLWVIMLPSER
jgi:hypothetical protein